MSRYRSDPEMWDYEKPSFCSQFLHYTWKTISCLFSHIALVAMVVSYCVLGAYTFASLEVANEIKVKEGIHLLRDNVTNHLWKFIDKMEALIEHNFTDEAEKYLKNFEGAILKAMTKDGWDGEEERDKVQWSFTGALFYSIIVITTIGYGHIAPKTTWGKVVTIFYAILGIPLMLLCLSNIGDIMATSFRFIYWRVCCYFCTKKPKKKRNRSGRSSVRTVSRSDHRGSSKSRNNSFRRSVRTSTKSADSGFVLSDMSPTSHSDTELRYHDEVSRRGATVPKLRPNRMSDVTPPKIRHLQNSTPSRTNSAPHSKANSLDRRKGPRDVEIELDPVLLANTPILCNKYVVGKNDGFLKNTTTKGAGEIDDVEARANASTNRRAKSMPRNHYLELPRFPSPESSDRDDGESVRGTHSRKRHSRRRSRSPNPQLRASPRMMTPLGYGHPSKYLDDPDSDEDYYDYYDDYSDFGRARTKPVPIWLCVLLVLSYILAGAYLFTYWEEWPYLDAAYFCFITLTTIGFGDLVPAKGVTQNATVSIALCSLYLLFGISLLAMSFNLVQDEVISNVKSVAKTLGIIKNESEDSEEEY